MTNEHKRPIQANRIIEYMRSHGSITTKEAMTELGVLRLASRIHELRSSGYNIGDVYLNVHDRYGNETRVKKYFIVGD